MKISVRQECGYVDLETESVEDVYCIGRIAAKFSGHAGITHDGSGKRRLELDLEKVVEKLAE